MSWTLKFKNGKILKLYNTLDKEKIYFDARKHLLYQFHEEKRLQEKLDKITSQYINYWDFECDQIQEKIDNIQLKAILYDAFNRVNAVYILEENYSVKESAVIKVNWK